jgi:hypothetical protein
LQGGSQHLEEACMRSASSLKLLCADCYSSRETPPLQETCRRATRLASAAVPRISSLR